MTELKIAFWNLQNLFDTKLSEIAADFEYTPNEGWDQDAFDAKIKNLAQIIDLLHNGKGPDLLGVCEVENKDVAEELIKACKRNDYELAHIESDDIRGIDTSLIYSKDIFEIIGDPKGHNVHLRYPTRDIFQVDLKVKENDAQMTVFVNHWPSRWRGEFLTEPYRITVANSCGRLADVILKYSKKDYIDMDDSQVTMDELNTKWNKNVLFMGDFNDEPFNRSIMVELKAASGEDKLEEEVKKSKNRQYTPSHEKYLKLQAYFYNCMCKFLGMPDEGTHFYSESTNTMNLLDQFIISRGLYYGLQSLKLEQDSVEIFKPSVMASGKKKRPKKFDKKTKKGYSDHFPIQAIIQTF
ncbi:MAG: hypothetical protein U9N83_03085 [Thermodesulfobacteriota bacterium]|nr:hypothetical protein [Thermodesulfobacteriota bacterium]